MRVRILAEYPNSIVFGGIELQCLRTFYKLKELGVSVDLLDYHNKDEKYDILHIFGNPASMYEICYYAAKTKKVIISAVCGATGPPGFKTRITRMLSDMANIAHQRTDNYRLRFMFQSASHIICLNELEKDYIAMNYDIALPKLTIINAGVEACYFHSTPDVFVEKYGMKDFVLYTGNIVERKNPLRLAKVLTRLGLKGVFIGEVFNAELEYAARFKEIISMNKDLLWIRGLPHDDPFLVSAYAAASLFCLPSSSETQSASALEAMATGTPIILGDFPYSYQPPFENALRCNHRDEQSIENCIKEALQSPSNYSMHLPGNFTWGNVAAEVQKVYERI